MMRFWDHAVAEESAPGGWRILLDGKPLRIPGGPELKLTAPRLATAIAEEWQAAGGASGGETSYEHLPLTRLAGTAQARIAPDPEPLVLELVRYGETDLLCYRAETPQALVLREQALWQPWLDWAADRLGVRLRVTSGIVAVAQDPAALAQLATAVAACGPFALGALGLAVPALGSLVLGLALAEGALTADEAHDLSVLDEMFQEESWGRDELALARRRRIGEEVALAERFLELLQP
jgi:chaperone required for assembly of F1-ATPase